MGIFAGGAVLVGYSHNTRYGMYYIEHPHDCYHVTVDTRTIAFNRGIMYVFLNYVPISPKR